MECVVKVQIDFTQLITCDLPGYYKYRNFIMFWSKTNNATYYMY